MSLVDEVSVSSPVAGTTSYWLAQPLPSVPTGRGAGPVDVVVVGAGVTGCSCALALAQAGLRVRVIEAREVAAGASGRNGGFALRGLAPSYDAAREALGSDTASRLWRLTEHALDRIADLAGDALRRSGGLRLAVDSAEREALRREHDALGEDGFAVEWLDPLPEPLAPLFAGALVHPGDGALSPALWVRRLASAAVAAGAEVVVGRALERDELEALPAGDVVVAVDGATAALLPELASWVTPVRGQVLSTEPLRSFRYARPHYARWGYDYWQQLPDGRLVLGGKRDVSFATERTAADATTPAVQRELEALAAALVGFAPRVEHRWSGCWGETPDSLPLVGRVPGTDRLWVAGGYSGHGNVLGFACGALVAEAILGREPEELAAFDPARFG
jgi:glycine/D-amino acid oxidase-like deaminating enzyme